MEIIKHGKGPEALERKYRLKCRCGCVCEFLENEFQTDHQTYKEYITCPECYSYYTKSSLRIRRIGWGGKEKITTEQQ